MLPDDPVARKKAQNQASHARRLARQAEEVAAHRNSPRLTGSISRATTIRLPFGKRIEPCEVPSWLSF